MALVIAIAGGRGAGKRTISKLLVSRLAAKRASFGEYLRGEARRVAIMPFIEGLQNLGQRLVSTEPASFVEMVLRAADWDRTGILVIDGIRHIEILDTLRSLLSPIPVQLVLISVASPFRKKRLEGRGENVTDFEQLDAAETEVQIFGLLP